MLAGQGGERSGSGELIPIPREATEEMALHELRVQVPHTSPIPLDFAYKFKDKMIKNFPPLTAER